MCDFGRVVNLYSFIGAADLLELGLYPKRVNRPSNDRDVSLTEPVGVASF
jgi:hypothetical protein